LLSPTTHMRDTEVASPVTRTMTSICNG
jgi:hypothetical protein